ncbi:protein bicaudal C homolog 1-B [Anopheles ziemanni]|uniref:protein bicaudal C homolog 1-B n=1 Tax=Anopheles coustani TaxID=139045 RepID=UPI0026588054|nr:protein bicaudal C homolog 1-B [Anopheles coustani]XP_058167825.1 protein bicaudal C homolog 1-B [Anopheles ziemanni]
MMASCSSFGRHIFLNGGPPSETTSEISSVESDWGDLRSIAAQLGVANPDDLHVERFKVDRQKLEDMIKVETYSEGMNSAEEFFTNVMKETTTYVSWPCRLKIGAKTKKDPHIRIVGKMTDVLRAKDKVMSRLDSRGSRVIMKMDVSYTDHSFIIGRGGNNIKKIMEETATHIHFPDSNRSNPTEKSNQVSMCGSIEGVERARSLVRHSTPLLISFELPILAPGKTPPDNDTPYVKEVEAEYGVQVIFSTRPKLHSSLVLVKGSEKEEQMVKEATRRLMDLMCENMANQIPVQMQLEISTQHHPIVLGRASSNLREIMNRTGTQIMFPDANDVNIKPIKRSQVTITGTITGVYLARQQLIGSLPIALIFDYPDNTVDSEEITKLMLTHDVFISVRQKSRQSTLCIVIKGIEKFIANIYEARHQLLKSTGPRVIAEVPRTYFGPTEHPQQTSQNISALLAGPVAPPFSPLSPINSMPFVGWPSPSPAPLGPSTEFAFSHMRGQFQNFHMAKPTSAHSQLHPLSIPPGLDRALVGGSGNKPSLHLPNPHLLSVPPGHGGGGGGGGGGFLHHQQHQSQLHQQQQQHHHHHQQQQYSLHQRNTQQHQQTSSGNVGNLSSSTTLTAGSQNNSHNDIHSSGYQSLNCSGSSSLDQPFQANSSTAGSLSAVSSTSLINGSPDHQSPSVSGAGGLGRCRHVTCTPESPQFPSDVEQRTPLAFDQKHSINETFLFNLDPRVVAGYKAMHMSPQQGEIRTPTLSWQGLGLSQSTPAPLEGCDLSWGNSSSSSSGGGGVGSGAANVSTSSSSSSGHNDSSRHNMTTTMIEVTPRHQREQMAQYNDVTTILTGLGLEHYIKNFINGEIDMTVFQTLTDQDLLNLDIKPLGARRRILMAIHDLCARQGNGLFGGSALSPSALPSSLSRFSGSAAPGAERRSSSGQ